MEGEVDSPAVGAGHIAVVLVFVSLVVATFTEIGIEMGEEVAILFYPAMAVLSFYFLLKVVVVAKKLVE